MEKEKMTEKEKLTELLQEYTNNNNGGGSNYERAEYLIANDVEIVQHGEWNIKSETIQMLDDVDEEIYVECPFCKRTFYVPFEIEDEKIIAYARENYPYCNCGVKMDGCK